MRLTCRSSLDDSNILSAPARVRELDTPNTRVLPRRRASESDASAWLGHLGVKAHNAVRKEVLQRVQAHGSAALLAPKPAWLPLPVPKADSAAAPAALTEACLPLVQWTEALFVPAASLTALSRIPTREHRMVLLADVNRDSNERGPKPEPVAVKWYDIAAQPQLARVFAKERAWIDALSASGATPKCLASDSSRGLMVLQRAAGRHIDAYELQSRSAGQVARALARLHAAAMPRDLAAATPTVAFPWSIERWLPFVQHLKLMPERTASRINALQQQVQQRLQQEPAVRTMIHGDPQLGNILLSEAGKVTLIDFEYGYRGDPMFDLAFFATSSHLSVGQMMDLLPSYHQELLAVGAQTHASDENRLLLYGAYQTLFRHVASHKEYLDGDRVNYARWLFHAHSHLAELDRRKLLNLTELGAEI